MVRRDRGKHGIADGRGVPPDNVLAYMWLDLAGRDMEKAREERDRIAQHMTRSEIAEAKKRARTCVESNYRNCLGVGRG